MPLARHSTLPELRNLVGLFRPKTIYPNTIGSKTHGQDYLSLPLWFGDDLASGGKERLAREASKYVSTLQNHLSLDTRDAMRYLSGSDTVEEARQEAVGRFVGTAEALDDDDPWKNFEHLDDIKEVMLLMSNDEKHARTHDECDKPSRVSRRNRGNCPLSSISILQPNAQLQHITSSKNTLGTPHSLQEVAQAAQEPLLSEPLFPACQKESILVITPGREYFLSGKAFYFCEGSLASIDIWRTRIEEAGGMVLLSGQNRKSCETAVGIADFVISPSRTGWDYEKVN